MAEKQVKMKKIALNQITSPEISSIYAKRNCYSLVLGNGITVRFTSTRDAMAFLNEVNRDLNFNLVILNQIYIDVHTHFRRVWFYLNNGLDGAGNERKIIGLFHDIDKNMDLMVTRSEWSNGNQFVFQYFKGCLNFLDEIIKILQEVEMKRNAYSEFYMLKVLLTRTNGIRSDILTMGMNRGTVKIIESHKILG